MIARPAALVILVAAFVGGLQMEAHAHVHSAYYVGVHGDSEVLVGYDADFPENVGVYTWRDRVANGRSNWPIASTLRPEIHFVDNETQYSYECVSGGSEVVNYVAVTDNPVADTCRIWDTGSHTLLNARIRVDNSYSWYVSDGIPIPSPYNTTHYDLEAVMTHEFGHFLGGGHFLQDGDPDDACPGSVGNTSQNTMCAGGTSPGLQYKRSTESHDRGTMHGAHTHYPD